MSQYGFGSGQLFGIRTDVANSTPVLFGVLQDVSIDFQGEIKDLFGQYQFPVDSARGKTKIMGKAKVGIISPLLFNNIFFGQTETTGQALASTGEAQTVGSVITGTTSAATAAGNATLHFTSTPVGVTVGASIADPTTSGAVPSGTYVLSTTGTTVVMSANATGSGVQSGDTINFGPIATASNSSNFDTDLGVLYSSTGVPLVKVAGSPTQGQYTVTSGGVYSFNSGDAGAAVLLNYLYDSTTSGNTITINNLLMGTTPKFEGVFTTKYEGMTLTMKLFQCVSSKLTFPTKIDDYMIQEMDFEAFANAAGNVCSWSASAA